MILLNKTLMCGGLVVIAPGSPLQVVFAILIMLLHLLFVLKLAPYEKDSEDWSAFFSTLGLCLLSLGALTMMLKVEEHQREIIGLVLTALPLMCIAVVVGIMFFIDGGVWKKIQEKSTCRVGKTNASTTQVQPVSANRSNEQLEKSNISEKVLLKSWE